MAEKAPVSEDLVEPGVRRFVDEVSAAFHAAAGGRELTPSERREIAESVRGPWRTGGPEMASTRDVQVPTPTGAIRVRIYVPRTAAAAASPVLVYMHGGGWVLFSVETHDRLMREYADRAGVVVAGVDYSRSPEVRFPVARNEVGAVVDWIGAGQAGTEVDPQRIALGGDSAGGNLALSTALKFRDEGRSGEIKALLLNYGAFDTVVSAAADEAWGGEGYMLEAGEMRDFWRDYLRSDADAADPLAVPARAELHGLPPALFTVAECDVLAEQSEALCRRMVEAGVEARAATYRGATHSFLEAMSVSPLAQRALQDGADWLRETLAA
jgi:acetyl esterase